MKLLDLLTESLTPEIAQTTFQSVVMSYIRTIRDIEIILDDYEGLTARRLAGRQMSEWVSDNYLSGKRANKVAGLQQAALTLSKMSENRAARDLYRELANITYSAARDSGKSKIFKQIGNIFGELAPIVENERLGSLLKQAHEQLRQVSPKGVATPTTDDEQPQPQKQPKDQLGGQQRNQAEQAFNSVVATLPKSVREKVRADTQRMDPSAKLAYLRRMMG